MSKQPTDFVLRLQYVLSLEGFTTTYITGMGSIHRRRLYEQRFHKRPPEWVSRIEAGMACEVLAIATGANMPLPTEIRIPESAERWTNSRNQLIGEYQRTFHRPPPSCIMTLDKHEAVMVLGDAVRSKTKLTNNGD